MSQSNTGQGQRAETRTQETRTFIRQVRAGSRRKYTPEEKIRIVLEGFRREVAVSDLCRREGIRPGTFYAWTKEFMEAGKERLTRDTIRDATRQEIESLKRENHDLKELVADLSLEVYRFKKNGHSRSGKHQRMSLQEKEAVIAQAEQVGWGKRQLLAQLKIPRSTYYRWRAQRQQGKLGIPSQARRIPWNRLSSEEEAIVLAAARKDPDLSSRQLAAWITDHQGFSVSEATVYRILRWAGLVKSPEMKLMAGKEYQRKTTGSHQLWATDASYFRVVGWGYYYLVTVMDDYSRFILAWKLQRDMTAAPSLKWSS